MKVDIPIEIIRLILLKLKVKSVIRFECVCKEWRSTIQDPDFKLSYRGRKRVMVVPRASGSLAVTFTTTTPRIETLFRVSENPTSFLNPTPIDHGWPSGVWCSCNGLVLFSVRQHILLWNPSIRCCTKVLELPPSYNNGRYPPGPYDVVSGLCYVSSTRDYKAVLLHRRERTVMVASLKNKEWRNVPFPYEARTARDGVNFHNTLHWWVIPSRRLFGPFGCEKIVYFETENNEFKELPTPKRRKSYIIVGLGIMDDCLCMARGTSYEIEVLVMKEYGVRRSWVSQFVISTAFDLMYGYLDITLYFLKCNTKVLIWRQYIGKLLVYDLKNNTLNNNFLPESVGYWGLVCIRHMNLFGEMIRTNPWRMMLC